MADDGPIDPTNPPPPPVCPVCGRKNCTDHQDGPTPRDIRRGSL